VDLGLAGSTAVVTGGSKGMGLAIAETLAAEGARVARHGPRQGSSRRRGGKLRAQARRTPWDLSVDMADAASITDAFASVADRWGQLNSLVHTIGPGDGYFEEMGDAEWDAAFALGTMSGVRSIRRRIAHAPRRGLGAHRDPVRTFHSATESTHRRVYRVEGGTVQRDQELVEKPCQGWHSGQLCVPRHHRDGEFSPKISKTSSPPTGSTPRTRTMS